MSGYSNNDTDWAESQAGNQWKRVNGTLLIAGKYKGSKFFWARVDAERLEDHFKTLEEAQIAAEKKQKVLEKSSLIRNGYDNY